MLIMSYLMAALILAYTSAGMTRSLNEHHVVLTHESQSNAFNYAESAIDKAIQQLTTGGTNSIAATTLGSGTYSATISQPASLGAGQYLVSGVGIENGITQTVEVIAQRTLKGSFPGALYGVNEVALKGSVTTDSYNSALGSYARTRGSNGDVATSSGLQDAIKIEGSALIDGDVTVGVNGSTELTGGTILTIGSAIVSGERRVASEPVSLPPATRPTNCTSRGQLKLAAQEAFTLAAGTYCYDEMILEAGAVFSGAGPVEIYVSGQVSMQDGSRLAGYLDRPGNLKIYVVGSGNVYMRNTSTNYAAIYAPESDVKIEHAAVLYGAVVGKSVKLEGSGVFHYDEALGGSSSSPSYKVSVLSWQVPKPLGLTATTTPPPVVEEPPVKIKPDPVIDTTNTTTTTTTSLNSTSSL